MGDQIPVLGASPQRDWTVFLSAQCRESRRETVKPRMFAWRVPVEQKDPAHSQLRRRRPLAAGRNGGFWVDLIRSLHRRVMAAICGYCSLMESRAGPSGSRRFRVPVFSACSFGT